MIETENRIARENEKLLDVDVTPDGSWVGFFRNGDRQVVRSSHGAAFKSPAKIVHPIVRHLDFGHILLVGYTSELDHDNAWILDVSGNLISTFCPGCAIEDVLICKNYIVFTYFDEGIYSGVHPSEQGIAVFDTKGEYQFGYLKEFGEHAVDVSDCYCACVGSDNEIWFLPYTDFPLVRLNLEKRVQQIHKTSRALAGAKALTKGATGFYFYGSNDLINSIFHWLPGDEEVQLCAKYVSSLRGLLDGRFLAFRTTGYTVIDMEAGED